MESRNFGVRARAVSPGISKASADPTDARMKSGRVPLASDIHASVMGNLS